MQVIFRQKSRILFCWDPQLVNPCPAERIYPAFANSVDPDHLASEEAN